MNSNQYLDAAKRALNLPSDYALAAKMQVRKQIIGEIRAGRQHLSTYLCTKIAIVLNIDPALVIADIEAQTEKNPVRAEFWRSFLCAARKGVLALILAAIYTGTLLPGQNALGGPFNALGGLFKRRPYFA